MALIRGREGGGHWGAGRHSSMVASHFVRRRPCVAVGGDGGDSDAGCVGAASGCEGSTGDEVGGVGVADCGVAGGGDAPLPLRRSALEPDAGSAGGGGDGCGDDAILALAAPVPAAATSAASVTAAAPASSISSHSVKRSTTGCCSNCASTTGPYGATETTAWRHACL